MGAPKAVPSQASTTEQKAEPVVASVKSGGTAGAVQASGREADSTSLSSPTAAETTEVETETVSPEKPEPEQKVAGIVEDSETLANVVVSDSQNLPNQEEIEADEEQDFGTTTEQAVLKEDADDDTEETTEPEKDHSADDETAEPEPIYGSLPNDDGFDEEATQISDLNLKNPLALGKPQMAESRKVKNKDKKFNPFGIFRRSKK